MRFALISDNHDTYLGMRLAGIEGVIVHDRDGVIKALEDATSDEQVGAVLITEKLVALARGKSTILSFGVQNRLSLKSPTGTVPDVRVTP